MRSEAGWTGPVQSPRTAPGLALPWPEKEEAGFLTNVSDSNSTEGCRVKTLPLTSHCPREVTSSVFCFQRDFMQVQEPISNSF